jgi:uncharacterized integral membrane protein
MKEYIRTGHLVYIIIIAIIVLSFFLVIAFGNTPNASVAMGTASTVSSLILSVIAIVLSLIDVAGQRQSIVDLKETAEKLTTSNVTSQELNKDLMVRLEEITLLRDQLVEQITINTEWKEDIKAILKGNTNDLKPDEYQSLVEKAIKILEKDKDKNENFNANVDIHGVVLQRPNKAMIKRIKEFLNKEYRYGETENMYILTEKIGIEFGISKPIIRTALHELDKQDYLEIYSANDSDIRYVKFKNF